MPSLTWREVKVYLQKSGSGTERTYASIMTTLFWTGLLTYSRGCRLALPKVAWFSGEPPRTSNMSSHLSSWDILDPVCGLCDMSKVVKSNGNCHFCFQVRCRMWVAYQLNQDADSAFRVFIKWVYNQVTTTLHLFRVLSQHLRQKK